MRPNRLKGHTLPNEGAVFRQGYRVREGATRCSCGEESPVLRSDYARKRWHREHKDASRSALAMRGGAESAPTYGDVLGYVVWFPPGVFSRPIDDRDRAVALLQQWSAACVCFLGEIRMVRIHAELVAAGMAT